LFENAMFNPSIAYSPSGGEVWATSHNTSAPVVLLQSFPPVLGGWRLPKDAQYQDHAGLSHASAACTEESCSFGFGRTYNGQWAKLIQTWSSSGRYIRRAEPVAVFFPYSRSIACGNLLVFWSEYIGRTLLISGNWRTELIRDSAYSAVCFKNETIFISGARTIYKYDVKTMTQSNLTLPDTVSGDKLRVTSVGNKVFFVGAGQSQTAVWYLQPDTSQFSLFANLTYGVSGRIVASIRSMIVVVNNNYVELLDTNTKRSYTYPILTSCAIGYDVGDSWFAAGDSLFCAETPGVYKVVEFRPELTAVRNPLISDLWVPYLFEERQSFQQVRGFVKNLNIDGKELETSPFIDGLLGMNYLPILKDTPFFVNLRADTTAYQWYIAYGPQNGTFVDHVNWNGNCSSFPCYMTVQNQDGALKYIASDYARGVVLQTTGCGDGYCENTEESCLTCPYDCSCALDEWRMEVWNDTSFNSVPVYIGSQQYIDLSNVPTDTQSYSVAFYSTIQFLTSRTVKFRLSATNGGVRMVLRPADTTKNWKGNNWIENFNSRVWDVQGWNVRKSSRFEKSYQLVGQRYYSILIEFFSNTPIDISSIKLEMYDDSTQMWTTDIPVHYSLAECGDDFVDLPFENSCPTDSSCGDGICAIDENNRNCIIDCADVIANDGECVEEIEGRRPLKGGMLLADDSLGGLIQNQISYTLPGMEHFTHGVNTFTGQEGASSIFRFTFCDQSRTVQDSYRGLVYSIPDQLSASPFPRCDYKTEANSFSSSNSYASSLDTKYGFKSSVSTSGMIKGITGAVDGSMQKEESVHEAQSLETEKSGRVISVESKCYTSKVDLISTSILSREFAKSLVEMGNNVEKCKAVVAQYGTHYYKSASLGGSLRQIFTMSEESWFSQSEYETSKSAQSSFDASVSVGPLFSASVDTETSESSTKKMSASEKFKKQSIKSSIITYGGAPGLFSPGSAESEGVSIDWGEWAQTIDLLPVPVDYSVGFIYDILPNNKTIRDCWSAGFLASAIPSTVQKSRYQMSISTGICKPGSDTRFGPFSFRFVGDRYTPERWMPLTNDESLSKGEALKFKCGSVINIPVTLPTIGTIKQLLITNISSIYPTSSISAEQIPSNWPLEYIKLTDMSTGMVLSFINATQSHVDQIYNCSATALGDGIKIYIDTDSYFSPIAPYNYTPVIDNLVFSVFIQGTDGSTSVIYSRSDCKTHNCWFDSGTTIIPIDTDGLIGQVTEVRFSAIVLNETMISNATAPFIIVSGISLEVTKESITRSYHNRTPFVLTAYGQGFRRGIEECLHTVNGTEREEMLSSFSVTQALCSGQLAPCKVDFPYDRKPECTEDIKEDCYYNRYSIVSHFYQACLNVPSPERVIPMISI